MSIGDNEWGFTANADTGERRFIMPQKGDCTFDELVWLLMVGVEFCAALESGMSEMLRRAEEAMKNGTTGKSQKKGYEN